MDSNLFSTYSIKVFYLEEKALKFLYTIPIWVEDIDDKALCPMYITHMNFENNNLQYTYDNMITVQRKFDIGSVTKFSHISDSETVSSTSVYMIDESELRSSI